MDITRQPVRHEDVIALAGRMSLRKIGDLFGLSGERVRQILAKHGIRNNQDRWTEFMELYDKGLTDAEIAAALGVGRTAIWHRRQARNLPSNSHKRMEDRMRQSIALFDQGRSRREIATRLGIQESSVSNCLHPMGRAYTAIGEDRKPRASRQHIDDVAPRVLVDLRRGLRQDQIAMRYDISQPVVSRIKREAMSS